MSKEGENNIPEIPSIKIEEPDPSELTYAQKLSRFGQSLLVSSSLNLITPPSPTTSKDAKMVEAYQCQFDMKAETVEVELGVLSQSLKADPPDASKISENLHFVKLMVQEAQQYHRKIVEILLKDKNKKTEWTTKEAFMSNLLRKVYRQEKAAEAKLAELKEKEPKQEEEAEGGADHHDRELLVNETLITENEEKNLDDELKVLESELDDGEPDKKKLPEMLESVQVCWSSFLLCQTALVERMRVLRMGDDIIVEMSSRKSYQARMVKCERRVKEQLAPPQSNNREQPIVLDGHHDRYHKDLPKLSGHPKEWLPFWAIFKETHENKNLSQLQKFRRLLQATSEGSPARDTVQLYSMSASNYSEALDHLKRDYGRDSILIKIYVREIMQIAIDRSSGKTVEFRKMVNEITANLKNLESLDVTSDQYSQFLYPMLEACLPKTTLQLWQEKESENLTDLITFLQKQVEKENERKLAHFVFTDNKPQDQKGGKGGGKQGGGDQGRRGARRVAGFHNAEEKVSCIFCEGKHLSADCRKALKMTFEEKQKVVKEKNVCFICFNPGHISRKCRDRGSIQCKTCERNHQSVLCPDLNNKQPEKKEDVFANQSSREGAPSAPSTMMNEHDEQPPRQPHSSTSNFSNMMESSEVPLQMLLVRVEGPTGKKKIVRAMLDTGSQRSYVTTTLQQELGFIPQGGETVVRQLFGGVVMPPEQQQCIKLRITGPGGEMPATFDASIIPTIVESTSTPPPGKWIEEFYNRGVVFPRFPESNRRVDVLIGNDVAPKLYCNNVVDLGNGPVAIQTRWGWVLGGKIPVPPKSKDELLSSVNITTTLCNLSLTQLWDLDLMGIKDDPTTKTTVELSKQTEEHFLRNVERDTEGRYIVSLPFLTGAVETLPSNFSTAEARLRGTTDNLRKSDYLDKYDALFRQWEAEGMIETININEQNNWKEIGHYLPHRAVIKLSSETTPVRPVFDASAKSKGQPSLNDCLDAGPNYLELIPSILSRFRMGKIGISSDIRKAFQMVGVNRDHRQYLRFLWWENPHRRDKLKVYQHARVPFGVNCSPFLLAATLHHHLSQSPKSHERTAKSLVKSFYVDNSFVSRRNMREALHFQNQSVELLKSAQFELRDWHIGPTGEQKEVPALGMIWDMGGDTLRVDIEAAIEKAENPTTQRNVLAVAHSLFDPLGMLSPFILPVKIILRQCHEAKVGWDRLLPEHLEEQFRKWKSQIPLISEVQVPRYAHKDQSRKTSLHVFSDASGEAYAAAVFLRCETAEGVKVTLLQSKARIATKGMRVSIPRMELIGCLVGVRLAATVREDLGDPSIPITYYTDSSVALAWILNEGPWGVFVTNRVEEIRKKTTVAQWRHVPGKHNPADLPSRGCSSAKLIESEWWLGRSWMYNPEDTWPISVNVSPNLEDVNKEKRKIVAINIAVPGKPHPLESFLKYSEYPKIIRLCSYWRRFIKIVQERVQNPNCVPLANGVRADPKNISPPTLTETEEAEHVIIRHVQKDLEQKTLGKLRPFTSNEILRTSTPIFHDQDNNFVHPIILPEKNEFVLRMLRWLHATNCHMGTQLLHARARAKFWVINGRKACRGVVGKCWVCRRFNAKRLEVPEVPLPRARTERGAAFSSIGVDMAGPFILKKGEKVWFALFTCATYRAIHLEVVDNMSTEEFLIAFRAFANRRGRPNIVYSDNGLNFVGANAAFQKTYRLETKKFAIENEIDWRFNPPNSPWVGGFYERLIGLVKSLAIKVLGKRVVTKKELVGLLMEIEEILNNRPLTYVSESHDDPVPLTPNMLVRNTGTSHFPELEIRDASHARAAFKRIQRIREMLRTSFRARYLGALENMRVGGVFRPLQIGDVVLLEQDNEKRVNWPLGVVVAAIPGKDNFPRTYSLKTKSGVVTRAAQRLFPMELQDPEEIRDENLEQVVPHSTTADVEENI